MSESNILRRIVLALSNGPVRLLRNNVGMLQDKDGRYVRYGLGVGTSDLIGWRTVTVTPEMVGKPVAQFVAIEVKAEGGRVSAEQERFIRLVRSVGGVAGVARSNDDAREILHG